MWSRIFSVHLIPMIETQFYLTLEQGARDMATLTGTSFSVSALESRSSETQIKQIQKAVKDGADALLVGAMDPVAISGAIEDAKAKGVKIIYVDTPAYEEAITTLASDNLNAGRTAGQKMLQQLKLAGIENGVIGILGINTETRSTLDREKGFSQAIKEDGKYTLLDTVYTEGYINVAKEVTEDFINENKNLVGIFAVNEETTIGLGQGIEEKKQSVIGIGFDYTAEIARMIEEGTLQAVIVQNPYTMGYLGMAQALAALNGYPTGPLFLNTGITIVDKNTKFKDKYVDSVKPVVAFSTNAQVQVFLIPIIKDQLFFIIEQGARAMADLTNVAFTTEYPTSSRPEEQIQLINNAVKQGANALMIAAADPIAITGAIEDAKAKGVKIIYIDAAAYEPAESTLATDNYSAGQLAGETIIALLGSVGIRNGSIGILGYNLTAPATISREKGFRQVIGANSQFKLLDTIYTEGNPVKAESTAEAIIRSTEKLVGMFGTNESNTYGIGKAIETTGIKVAGIGFDLTVAIWEMVQKNILQAVFVQNAYTMGYLGMAQAIASVKGYPTGPPFLNTGISVVNQYSISSSLLNEMYETEKPVEKGYLVYVVLTFRDQYWLMLYQGAKDMAELLNIQSVMSIPESRSAVDQSKKINEAVEAGANAILIGATDQTGIVDAVRNAKERGVKIVYVDAAADEEAVITLATDNLSAGRIAGAAMLTELSAVGIRSGTIGILTINLETPTTMAREMGFRQVINENGQFKLLDSVYTNSIPEVAKEAAERMMANTEDLVGIFATSVGDTLGLGRALEESERAIIGIGFDYSEEVEKFIQDGALQAVLVQNQYTMGYLGMAEAMAALSGYDTGPSYINTGVTLVNKYSHELFYRQNMRELKPGAMT